MQFHNLQRAVCNGSQSDDDVFDFVSQKEVSIDNNNTMVSGISYKIQRPWSLHLLELGLFSLFEFPHRNDSPLQTRRREIPPLGQPVGHSVLALLGNIDFLLLPQLL
mmetsp:Transcript_26820/g.53594  ORF Transcript_26820/g.53594 Transcript_26820/m.53594 type:complete len:107 (+) Transcript_26820:121-441(+)